MWPIFMIICLCLISLLFPPTLGIHYSDIHCFHVQMDTSSPAKTSPTCWVGGGGDVGVIINRIIIDLHINQAHLKHM